MAFRRLVLPGTLTFGSLVTFGFSTLQAKPKGEQKTSERVARVAIIGSGIGGSSAAHFVRQILGPDAQIQVFERADKVGGRMAAIEVAGNVYEAGGSIIHPENMYMKSFVKELGLGVLKSNVGIFALHNGDNLAFETSTWSWLNAIKFLWRYGFSLVKMQGIVKNLMRKFSNIYKLQDQGEMFETVPDMLRSMGDEEFYNLTQMSTQKYLKEEGLSQQLIDELVTAVMRINYGQSTELNAFTGCVSLAGSTSGLWSVEGGNWKVCKGLLENSKAIVKKNTHVIKIIKKKPDEQHSPLYYIRTAESLINTPFDAVIVAMPLEVRQNFVGCDGCSRWPHQQELGEFHQTVATFQKAKLNESTLAFGTRPNTVGTMEKSEINFNSVGQQTSVFKERVDDEEGQVWKVFSREPLTKKFREMLFSQSQDPKELIWLAYPHYTPPEKFLPFVLDEGVFYVNAIEWVASAMEMSALSGRNAAMLTGRFLKKANSSSPKKEEGRDEL